MNEAKIIVERTTTLDEDMSAEVIDRVEGIFITWNLEYHEVKVEQVIIILMDINLVMLELLII